MRMTVEVGGARHDVAVQAPPETTVAALAVAVVVAVGAGAEHRWQLVEVVDGRLRRLPDDHGIDEVGLRDGTMVRLVMSGDTGDTAPGGSTAHPAAGPGPAGEVAVVGGLDAGRTVSLDAGRHLVGRGDGAVLGHPTVSARHARLDVGLDGSLRVRDLGSRNGTLVDGEPATVARDVDGSAWARLGAQLVRRRTTGPSRDRGAGAGGDRAPEAGRATDRATVRDGALHRPPRLAPPPLPGPVAAPRLAGAEDGGLPTLPVAATLGAVAAGAVMYAFTGSVLMVAMSAMAALAALASGVAARRRARRDRRRLRRADRDALAAFAAAVTAAARQQQAGLRARHPDPVEVVRRATTPSTRVWERRIGHDDLLVGSVGHASGPWRPLLSGVADQPAEDVEAVLTRHGRLVDVPVPVHLDGEVVGIVGDRAAALAVARWLVVEAATHHGPADLALSLVVDDPAHAEAWGWCKWLPHLRDPEPSVAVGAGGRDLLADLLDRLGEDGGRATSGPRRVVVLDGVATVTGPRAAGREVLRRAGGLVVAEREDQLPASCSTVVRLHGPDGRAAVVDVATGATREDVLATGVSVATATGVARALAGLDDPERAAGGRLPTDVAWMPATGDGLQVALGVGADGPVVVDLERDGPHALVAGTTGAGKSELLRTLVAGLAANATPDRVNFVLIDYKGGSAFDRCADLPHVVGVVTDLDDSLAERALQCLRAELAHRERRLRDAGVADLRAHRALPGVDPLPSLVVCIDEFAALAAELPDFLTALVGIAQRGRSLGVHLVLATQRPAGVVNDDIRANTNLRIALRVQDRQDSLDVIEVPDAAALPRDVPGRALVRFGPGEVIALQAARVTGPAVVAKADVQVRPFGLLALPTDARAHRLDEGPTELDRLVEAARDRWRTSGRPAPRQPWPPPLPDDLDLDDPRLTADDRAVLAVGLADEPDAQRQVATGWRLDDGNLAVVGVAGSGTTTALRSLGVTAGRFGHELWVVDADRGELDDLADLPSCGGVVRAAEAERLRRLVDRLVGEVERRRGNGDRGGQHRRVVVLVDGWDRLVDGDDWDDPVAQGLQRLVVDGGGVGVHVAMSLGRPGALSTRIAAAVTQRWVLRLADPHDAALLGATLPPGGLAPGRAVEVPSGRQVQVARPWRAWPEIIAGAPVAARPAPVATLPDRVWVADVLTADPTGACPRVGPGAGPGGGPGGAGSMWRLPVGIDGDTLDVARLELFAREHALVVGPPRSGRSTVLAAMAALAAAAPAGLPAEARVVGVAPRGGPLAAVGVEMVEAAALADLLREGATPLLVLCDDADRYVDDPRLAAALADAGDDVRVVAAARADVVRGAYGSWLRGLAASRCGLLLEPDRDLDPDLFGVTLPRRPVAPPAPGRGWLVQDGRVVQVQVAQPTDESLRRAA